MIKGNIQKTTKESEFILENELKGQFIKYFKEELWNEEEILSIYQKAVVLVCQKYLRAKPIPVVFDDLEDECSRYDINLATIILNRKYKYNYVEMMNSTLHELEHYYQFLYIDNLNTTKAKRWKKIIKSRKASDFDELEIDAYAFAKVVGNCEFGFNYVIGIDEIDVVIDEYISKGKIISND